MPLEALPRTLSGKVDRRALPNPGEAGREHVAPRTPVEEALCGIFSELLGIPKIGIRDHFFELGGHSLLATMLLSRTRSAFGVEVPLREVFRTPTPEGLALMVVRLRAEQESGDEMAALLRQVEGMSEEELQQTIRSRAKVQGETDGVA